MLMKARNIRWKALLASISVLIAVSPVMPAEPLQGTVEFSRDLPPLGDEYREGQKFRIEASRSVGKVLRWRRVPDWLAGIWHTERSVRKVMGIPVSYQTRTNFISGYQADAKGQIWHPINSKVTRVDASSHYEYQIPQGDEVFTVDESSSRRFTRTTRVRVEKESGLILDSFQQEDISVTQPLEDGKCVAKARCRVFNMKGKKIAEQDIVVYHQRIEEFKPIDEFAGDDYAKGLANYLIAEGKPELVPQAPHDSRKLSKLQLEILNQQEENSALMETIKSIQESDN